VPLGRENQTRLAPVYSALLPEQFDRALTERQGFPHALFHGQQLDALALSNDQ